MATTAITSFVRAVVRQAKCPVVVAKLDRLSRDVAFIAGLMEGNTTASRPLAVQTLQLTTSTFLTCKRYAVLV
jgi:hypothetical protein